MGDSTVTGMVSSKTIQKRFRNRPPSARGGRHAQSNRVPCAFHVVRDHWKQSVSVRVGAYDDPEMVVPGVRIAGLWGFQSVVQCALCMFVFIHLSIPPCFKTSKQ